MSELQTQFEFTLPLGYVDQHGDRHRQGTMRLATAADEIAPYRDPRVQANPQYLGVIILSRVVELDDVDVNPKVVEALFASDLSYLQTMYNRLNANGESAAWATCPHCNERFQLQGDGESPGE